MTGRHAADLPVHVRRCYDDMAYLWYFDKPTEIGFEWTGSSHDPIEVSHGGFGEPITNIVTTTVNGTDLTDYLRSGLGLEETIGRFESICLSWVQAITADIRSQEPQAVINSGDVVLNG